MRQAITTLPAELARSITWDQGKEMAYHADFTIATGIPVCFTPGKITGWEGRGLARFPLITARFQSPPVKPCMRFSRTRLTDVLHRRCSASRASPGRAWAG